MRYLVSAGLFFLLGFYSTLCAYGADTYVSDKAYGFRKDQIRNLVTFGDSYTDIATIGNDSVAWPVYAAGYANVSLYPYARAGATCSKNLTFMPFPSLFESQLPLYFTDHGNSSGHDNLAPDETLYSLWIGTNDVGANALLTGNDAASLVDVTKCMINWVRMLYKGGARNFLFQNMIPLQNTVTYCPHSYPNRYWTAPKNATEWSVFMTELVHSGNALTQLMLEALVPALPDIHLGLFDSYGLFDDMYHNPASYLNGTAPLNVTGAIRACVYQEGEPLSNPGTCTIATGSARDSFLWYDEIHPSEQAGRMVAREIAQVIRGEDNKWTSWLS